MTDEELVMLAELMQFIIDDAVTEDEAVTALWLCGIIKRLDDDLQEMTLAYQELKGVYSGIQTE